MGMVYQLDRYRQLSKNRSGPKSLRVLFPERHLTELVHTILFPIQQLLAEAPR